MMDFLEMEVGDRVGSLELVGRLYRGFHEFRAQQQQGRAIV